MCSSYDRDYLEPFERCKSYNNNFKQKNYKTPADLEKRDNLVDKKLFNDMRCRSAEDFTFGTQGWVKEFKNNMPYKRPFVINGYEINEMFKTQRAQGFHHEDEKAVIDEQSLSSDEEEMREI